MIHSNSFCLFPSWKRNKRKIAFARGQATTDCRGRPLPSRKTSPPCGCRRECFSQVDVHKRWRILETFNGMGDTSSQNIYLRALIVGKDPKRLGSGGSLGINKAGKERKCAFSHEYFVQTSYLKRIPVCDLINLENLPCLVLLVTTLYFIRTSQFWSQVVFGLVLL